MEESYGWASRIAPTSPVPLVVRLHGPWFLNGLANGVREDAAFHRRNLWERKGLIAAAGVTAPSRAVLDATRNRFGLELKNSAVIPNPVEPVNPDGRWSLQACDQNRVLVVGRFDRHKGGDLMIDAFCRILQAR